MKLSFFSKRNTNTNRSETNLNNLKQEFLRKLETTLPLTSGMLEITYVFLCDHGRKGENYAAKLAESGDTVKYSKTSPKNYLIKGTTQAMMPDTVLIKEHLLALFENGLKYNCTLTEWSFADPARDRFLG